MPPVEQNTVPLGHSYVVSLGELKTVGKASEIPVVSDTFKVAASYATQISENASVLSAKQYVEEGIKTLSETETFSALQGKVTEKVTEINSNPKVKETLENVKEKMSLHLDSVKGKVVDTVEHLDTLAAGGIDTLTTKVPALNSPTKELYQTTKETASSYFSLATEYVATFAVAQMSLKLADKSLNLVEKTTKYLHPDTKDKSMLAVTYSKLRQTRRALRVVKRAGERKRYLESDPVARVGLAGSLASMLGLNSLLDMFGLKIVAEKRVRPEVEAVEDSDENHRQIADLKGDLAGYKSEEDPDYHPDTEDSIDGEETDSGSEGETEEVVEAVPEFDQAETEAPTETLPEAEPAVPEAELVISETEAAVPEAEVAVPEAEVAVPEVAVPEAEAAVPEAEAAVPEVEGMPEAITEGVPPALIDLMKANRDETHQSIDTQL